MTEIPIACTLSGSDYRRRMAEIAAVGRDALIETTSSAGSATLRFRYRPGIRDRLQRIVDAEADCCAFLDLHLTKAGDELALSIAAPAEGRFMVEELTAAFRGVPGSRQDASSSAVPRAPAQP